MGSINILNIERKWQKKWEESKAFEVKESKKKKFYVLEMFPYPSGSGLHMGHALNYTIGDIQARYRRMNGNNVLYPMGYDAFGLPAENAAIKAGEHPRKYTENSMKNFVMQQKALGLSYDWSRMIRTCDVEYYKWNQYFFLQFLKKGLVYRKKAAVNWCPKCNTVLANEQVHGGKCWRHEDTDVEIKPLEQWFIKTTDYAEELLQTGNLDWPERIKIMQENWIGKSEGTEILFEINGEKWPIFTTRPDTIFGVTFMVVSAQHPRLMELVSEKQKNEVEEFLKKLKSVSEKDSVDMEKEGVFTGSYALNPINGEKVPVWAGNFVVADYGSGMVMAVPAHDQRDFEFAKKYGIPIKKVVEDDSTKVVVIKRSLKPEFYKKISSFGKIIENDGIAEIYSDKVDEIFKIALENNFVGSPWYIHSEGKIKKILLYSIKDYRIFDWSVNSEKDSAKKFGVKIGINNNQLDFDQIRSAYEGQGVLINSSGFNDLANSEAKEHVTNALNEKGLGKKVVNYKLRDWLVSRQRYWGTPIPIIYCDKCGVVPVPENDLPVELPEKVKFGVGNPLESNKTFVEAKCPKCKGKGRRETDTMDTFFDSSWYYLRFCDHENKKNAFDKKIVDSWMPVDQYIGGAEHACMHLIYARFFTKALRDLEFLKVDEPFKRLFNQGMLHGSDGNKMSKSLGNVVNPIEMINKFGADALRFNLMSLASPDKDSMWNDTTLESAHKWVLRLASLFENLNLGKSSARIESKINKAIKEVTLDIEKFGYNFAIIKLRALLEALEEEKEVAKKDLESFLQLLSPICPHIAEELWEKIGGKGFVSLSEWPKVNEGKIDEKLEESEKNVEKTVADVINVLRIVKEKGEDAERVYLYVMPFEVANYDIGILSKRIGKEVKVFAVNDKNKYDPQSKSGKAKPGKPGIFVE